MLKTWYKVEQHLLFIINAKSFIDGLEKIARSRRTILKRILKNLYYHDIFTLKLYCRYLYTRPCMINHIWGLKQLWLQVNGHAWFHLQRLRWPVRNGEGAKNSKWKYMSPAGFEPTPRQSTTGKLQRLRYQVEHYSLTVFWNGYVTIPVWNRLWFDTQCKVL